MKTKSTTQWAGALAALVMTSAAHAQDYATSAVDASGDGLALDVAMNVDSFFGFYPTFAASYGINDKVDFTAYGIFWSAGSAGGSWGDWNEFGGGLSYNLTESISINPQIGFVSGTLLSSGAAAGESELGDGWVPNLTVNLDSDSWEGQIYAGLYLPIEDQAPPAGTDLEFLHTWINLGYKVNELFSVGGHLEHLSGGASYSDGTVYTWVGPYIQFRNEDTGAFVRFAGGIEAKGSNNEDTFWKMTAGFSF